VLEVLMSLVPDSLPFVPVEGVELSAHSDSTPGRRIVRLPQANKSGTAVRNSMPRVWGSHVYPFFGAVNLLDRRRADDVLLDGPPISPGVVALLSQHPVDRGSTDAEGGRYRARRLTVHALCQSGFGEIGRVAERVGTPRPIVAQQLHNLLARRIEDEYAEYAAVTGLATMFYNPLGGGLLTGKHQFTMEPTEGRFGDSRLATM
jgi:hypothetical protein